MYQGIFAYPDTSLDFRSLAPLVGQCPVFVQHCRYFCRPPTPKWSIPMHMHTRTCMYALPRVRTYTHTSPRTLHTHTSPRTLHMRAFDPCGHCSETYRVHVLWWWCTRATAHRHVHAMQRVRLLYSGQTLQSTVHPTKT